MPRVIPRSAVDLRRPLVRDTLIATVIAVLSLVSLWTPSSMVNYDFRNPDALGVTLALVAAGSVVLRGRYPVGALLLAILTALPLVILGFSQAVGGIPIAFTLYTVAADRHLRTSLAAGLLTLACLGAVLYTGPLEPTMADWLGNAVVVSVVWGLGRSVRNRRARLTDNAARDQALASAEAAEQRATAIRQRAQVAQEVQDVVAHSLAEITVHVAAARRLVQKDPSQAIRTLSDAEDEGRAALQEMRRLFTLMSEPEDHVAMRPMPRLDAVHELVEAERAHGTAVELVHEGEPREMLPGPALTVYRVVEEALTNARRHGGASRVAIRMAWTTDDVAVTVTDDGVGARVRWPEQGEPTPGRLSHLAERVRVYGGDLRWGRCGNGGFTLAAELPLTDREYSS